MAIRFKLCFDGDSRAFRDIGEFAVEDVSASIELQGYFYCFTRSIGVACHNGIYQVSLVCGDGKLETTGVRIAYPAADRRGNNRVITLIFIGDTRFLFTDNIAARRRSIIRFTRTGIFSAFTCYR